MITRAVIPAAGMGTRLLPATKEQPKEMLPIFAPSSDGEFTVKPLLQLIFEQLYDVGIREFYFIIGRGKRIIEDHFTQDKDYLAHLERQRKNHCVDDLSAFYRRLDDSNVVWINQPIQLGFGDAILRAKKAIGDSDFLTHAGDTYIVSNGNKHLHDLNMIFTREKPDAIFLIKHMSDVRQRGVVQGSEISDGLYEVDMVVEKPEHPVSNLGIEPVYLFRHSIFKFLEETKPGTEDEVQLTDAIQGLINSGGKVIAWLLHDDSLRLDIGKPESYWEAMQLSYRYASGKA